jgi:hypothetical protein
MRVSGVAASRFSAALQPVELEVVQLVKVHLKKIASDNVPQGWGRGSMGSPEEPERKRCHLDPHHPASPPLKKPAITSVSDEKKVPFHCCLCGLYKRRCSVFFWCRKRL